MINCKVQLEIQNTGKYILKEFEYKYHLNQTLYYVYKKLFSNKYKIKKVSVASFVCTNIPSYQLNNGWCVSEDDLFDNLEEAVKRCDFLNKAKRYGV